MGIKFDVRDNFYDLGKCIEDLGVNDVGVSARMALNVAMRRGRVIVNKELRKDISLKSGAINKRIRIIQAKGNNISRMEGVMIFSGIPIGMMEFVVGKKTKIEQKGIKVRKRRKLKAKIAPGKTFRLKGAFIQDVKSTQVFRRRSEGRRVRKLGVSSIAVIAFRRPRRDILVNVLTTRFNREFNRQINWRHEKTSRKYSKSPMRLPR